MAGLTYDDVVSRQMALIEGDMSELRGILARAASIDEWLEDEDRERFTKIREELHGINLRLSVWTQHLGNLERKVADARATS